MNVVAVITQPVHEEWINATALTRANKEQTQQEKCDTTSARSGTGSGHVSPKPVAYTVKGFAYAGGGRRVVLVEVTLDRGARWQSATLQFVDGGMERLSAAHSRNERHWSWCHWTLDVQLHAFFHAPDIRCRAFDSAYNATPEQPVWNFRGNTSRSHRTPHTRNVAT